MDRNTFLTYEWKDGAYYAMGSDDESSDSYMLYHCVVEDGIAYLGEEDACGLIDEYLPANRFFFSSIVVIPQSA